MKDLSAARSNIPVKDGPTNATVGFLQRKCACGQHTIAGGECEACKKNHTKMKRYFSREAVSRVPGEAGLCANREPSKSGRNLENANPLARRITIQHQRIDLQSDDPIHGPLLEEYRRTTGEPPGGIDQRGQQVGPTDAELKYSGILGRQGSARWLAPVINRRNFAEVFFRSQALIGNTGGLTTQFINESEVHSNIDVERAIPEPPVASQSEGSTVRCWYTQGINVTGRTTMDIFTPGPWDFNVSKEQAAERFHFSSCRSGGGIARIHIDARPDDAAMEAFVRMGEAEHDADTQQAFDRNIAVYVGNINRLAGNTPATRASGRDPRSCESNLHRLANRDFLTQFVIDLNTATARRHTGSRHGISVRGITDDNGDCSLISVEAHAGRL